MKSTILFVTPTLARTGSEVALANLLNSIDVGKFSAVVFADWGNCDLIEALPQHVRVIRAPLSKRFFRNRILRYLSQKFATPVYIWILIKYFRPKVIYVNTITLPRIVAIGAAHKIPVILHAHELENMFALLNIQECTNTINTPRHVIAASQRAANVFEVMGRTGAVTVIHSPIAEFNTDDQRATSGKTNRKRSDPFTWIMVGSLDANKNPVRFVEIANRILRLRSQDNFIWIGSGDSGYSLYAEKLANILRPGKQIQWLKPRDQGHYRKVVAQADGFLITSDAESLSLVAIEGLAAGKPVVSFDNGGVSEILTKRTGVIIPRFDLDTCVRKMVQIANGTLNFEPRELRRRASQFGVQSKAVPWNQVLAQTANSDPNNFIS